MSKLRGKNSPFVPPRSFIDQAKRLVPLGVEKMVNGFLNRSKNALRNASRRKKKSKKNSRERITGQVFMESTSNSASSTNLGSSGLYIPQSVMDTLAPYHYVFNTTGNGTSLTGLQDAFTSVIGATSDLLSLQQTYTGGVSGARKMLLESYDCEVSLANASATSCEFTIYDLIARKDCVTAATANPKTSWLQGISDEISGAGVTKYQQVGALPTQSDLFNQYWKIKKITKIELSPGGIHRHRTHMKPNRVIHEEYISNVAYAIKDVSSAFLIVQKGQPTHDSTTKTQIRLSPSSLDIVYSYSFNYKFLANAAVEWFSSNTLGTTYPVGEELVNEAVGQVQNVAGLLPGTINA